MHRIRSLWMGTRTSRINALRGFCREFGIAIPVGARTGVEVISRVLADPSTAVPDLIRGTARLLIEEIRLLEARIAQLERELAALAKQSAACTTLLSISGIGLLTATALVAATSGDVRHFKDARHFSSWLDLTPKEYNSGSSRYFGTHLQASRPLPAHAAHARGQERAASGQGGRRRGQGSLWRTALGIGCIRPNQAQQGRLGSSQQNGAHWLRHAHRQGALCPRQETHQKDQQAEFCDAGLRPEHTKTAVNKEEDLSRHPLNLRRD